MMVMSCRGGSQGWSVPAVLLLFPSQGALFSQAAQNRRTALPSVPAGKPGDVSWREAPAMSHYDEIEIEDMDWNDELAAFTWSCPCGDLFQITMVRL